MTTTSANLTIPSADIIRLILHHLIECGLHETAKTLRSESGIGTTSTFTNDNNGKSNNLAQLCKNGEYGALLEHLQMLDPSLLQLKSRRSKSDGGRTKTKDFKKILSDIHEMSILELAATVTDTNQSQNLDLARAALRLCHNSNYPVISEEDGAHIEQKLKELKAIQDKSNISSSSQKVVFLPMDFYNYNPSNDGNGNQSCEKRRTQLAEDVQNLNIPAAPTGRLTTLLQQAVKWQSYTGQLSSVISLSNNYNDDDDLQELEEEEHPRKKKKRKRTSNNVIFDIILGTPPVVSPVIRDYATSGNSNANADTSDGKEFSLSSNKECIGRIKLGTRTEAKCALFLGDGNGLVTGSSDGFIEIWYINTRDNQYKLNTVDYSYQAEDDLMLHDSAVLALAISRDGEMIASGCADGNVRIWKIATGKCLREFERAHSGAITCLAFSKSGSQILTGSEDGLCREYGLRATKMLKEFRGHTSYITSCHYCYDKDDGNNSNKIATAGADGSFRIWNLKTTEIKHAVYPATNLTTTSIANNSDGSGMESKSIIYMQPLHTPAGTFIIAPRGPTAFLIDEAGNVIKRYDMPTSQKDIISVVVAPSNEFLYCISEDHTCACFNVMHSKLISLLLIDSSNREIKPSDSFISISDIVLAHHPHYDMLAACSTELNDKNKRRGIIRFWK